MQPASQLRGRQRKMLPALQLQGRQQGRRGKMRALNLHHAVHFTSEAHLWLV